MKLKPDQIERATLLAETKLALLDQLTKAVARRESGVALSVARAYRALAGMVSNKDAKRIRDARNATGTVLLNAVREANVTSNSLEAYAKAYSLLRRSWERYEIEDDEDEDPDDADDDEE